MSIWHSWIDLWAIVKLTHFNFLFCLLGTQNISKRDENKQAEKLKSREMKEGWMKNDKQWMKNEWRMIKDEWSMIKDEWRMIKDECRMMKDESWGMMISICRGVLQTTKWTDRQTDNICDCRAAFATENLLCYSLANAESEQFKLDYDGTCTCPTGLNK